MKVLVEFPDENLIIDILITGEVTVLAGESTHDDNRSQMAVFIRYVNAGTNLPVEKFMATVKLTTSKNAIDLYETLVNVFSAKGIEPSKIIRFSGFSPHSLYINSRNHRLALYFVHVLPKYDALTRLDTLLISIPKTSYFSKVKQTVFERAQVEHDMKPSKIIIAVVTRWLTHGEACTGVIFRFATLIDTLDAIYLERGDTESKSVRDILLGPDIISMLLLLSDVLAPINLFSKFLQTSTLIYNSVSAKLNRLLGRLARINEKL